MHRTDRHYDRIFWRNLAACNGLQHRHKLRRADDRIDRHVGHRAVSAAPLDREREAIGRRKERPVTDADLADLEPTVEMQREAPIDVRILERALLDHQLVAGGALFGRLKTEDDRSRDELTMARQRACGAEQNGDVSVVTARMHRALAGRAVRNVADFIHRKAVHVGAQQRHRPGPSTLERRENARFPDAGTNLVEITRAQLAFDERRGLVLLERQLRVRVKVTAEANQLLDRHPNLRWRDHRLNLPSRRGAPLHARSAERPCGRGFP